MVSLFEKFPHKAAKNSFDKNPAPAIEVYMWNENFDFGKSPIDATIITK